MKAITNLRQNPVFPYNLHACTVYFMINIVSSIRTSLRFHKMNYYYGSGGGSLAKVQKVIIDEFKQSQPISTSDVNSLYLQIVRRRLKLSGFSANDKIKVIDQIIANLKS